MPDRFGRLLQPVALLLLLVSLVQPSSTGLVSGFDTAYSRDRCFRQTGVLSKCLRGTQYHNVYCDCVSCSPVLAFCTSVLERDSLPDPVCQKFAGMDYCGLGLRPTTSAMAATSTSVGADAHTHFASTTDSYSSGTVNSPGIQQLGSNQTSTLSPGAAAAIVIPVVVVMAVAAGVIFAYHRRRREKGGFCGDEHCLGFLGCKEDRHHSSGPPLAEKECVELILLPQRQDSNITTNSNTSNNNGETGASVTSPPWQPELDDDPIVPPQVLTQPLPVPYSPVIPDELPPALGRQHQREKSRKRTDGSRNV